MSILYDLNKKKNLEKAALVADEHLDVFARFIRFLFSSKDESNDAKEGIIRVGHRCLYLEDYKCFDQMKKELKEKHLKENIYIIESITNSEITIVRENDSNIKSTILKSELFNDFCGLKLIPDIYVRHLNLDVYGYIYWHRANKCLRKVLLNEIVNFKFCNKKECCDIRIGHLINNLHIQNTTQKETIHIDNVPRIRGQNNTQKVYNRYAILYDK